VEQQLEPFTRRELALGVLRVDAFLPAAQACAAALFLELFEYVVHGVSSDQVIMSIKRRAATEAATRPARTCAVSCGSAAATCACARKRSCSSASRRSHIEASSCWWRRAASRPLAAC